MNKKDQNIANQTQSLLDILSIKLETDTLFECFVGLISDDKTFEDQEIHVVPAYNFRRNYRDDIAGIKELIYFDEEYDEYIKH